MLRPFHALLTYLAFAVTLAAIAGLSIDLAQTATAASHTAHTVVLVAKN
ncbi:MAG: hypothetical protein JWO66_419 [Candidatus Eremiobacteraeota bacterium]|jgi:hypothetical protein|nr:hypothetical protein [Candidatus Eremiobacteraeota bacterium]